VLRRRKWVIAQAVALLPLAAVLYSLQQSQLFEASAEVLLSRQNLAATLTNTQDPLASQQAERVAQTQADVARVPTVAARVLEAAGVNRAPEQLLQASSVRPKPDSDLLVFKVRDHHPDTAARLASIYAGQFTLYRRELDTAAFKRARRELDERIARLEANGDHGTPLYANLVDKEQQLRTLEALQVSNAYVVRSAENAKQVRPKPVRNGVLGLALGLVLGIGLAFLWEALDTRVRSAEEISDHVGLPLLARLPEPAKRLRSRHELVMLAEPTGSQAEAFRMLRTNVEFANLELGARTIMVTSALEGEGKSTSIANLAVACARAGKRVVLVDLDLRRPFLDRFFGLEHHRGLTDVALGHVELDDAIASIPLTDKGLAAWNRANGNGRASVEGLLDVLVSGPLPPDAGEFVSSEAVAEILQHLRKQYELVLVDSPPLLHVGDGMALAAKVEGLLLVTRLRLARRQVLSELHRILGTLPAQPLGFVVAGAQLDQQYGYAYAEYYDGSKKPAAARRQVV
jgi:tyrosine-protein kinase